jgi:hypothetical protein
MTEASHQKLLFLVSFKAAIYNEKSNRSHNYRNWRQGAFAGDGVVPAFCRRACGSHVDESLPILNFPIR